ncbi:BON domain-containing protein [Actimicrobium antarcticum]|uniref:BON domain-containing protein n=1 Tax=Actimicrobium antarcticum TaxID=1051899 RepID=A0ABP7TS34_9BURK
MNTRFRVAICSAAAFTLIGLGGCNKTPKVSGEASSGSVNLADADVTTNVKTALLHDAILNGFDIHVTTLKGDVRLDGIVDTQSRIDTTIKLIRGVDGVHTIHDGLTIKK